MNTTFDWCLYIYASRECTLHCIICLYVVCIGQKQNLLITCLDFLKSLCVKIDRCLGIWVIVTLETGKDRFDLILFKVRFVSFSPPKKKHYPLACARHE